MAKKPYPFSVCEQCAGGGTSGGDVDLSNYLSKDNEEEYTPTSPYNPATKKYVDDAVEGSKYKGGSTDTVDVKVGNERSKTYSLVGQTMIGFAVNSDDVKVVLTDKNSVGIYSVIVDYADGEFASFDYPSEGIDLTTYDGAYYVTVAVGNGVTPLEFGELEVTITSSTPIVSAYVKEGSIQPKHLASGVVEFNNNDIITVSNGKTYVAQEEIIDLEIKYPNTDFLCSLNFTTNSSMAATVILPSSSKYIGAPPTFGLGETWELSINNGVVVGGKVG